MEQYKRAYDDFIGWLLIPESFVEHHVEYCCLPLTKHHVFLAMAEPCPLLLDAHLTDNQRNLVLSLATHKPLFNDIDAHPEADVRLRFGRLRAIRAQYVEGKTQDAELDFDQFMEAVRSGKKDAQSAAVQRECDQIMLKVDKYLDWNSTYQQVPHRPHCSTHANYY
jgi:hypothetical protein